VELVSRGYEALEVTSATISGQQMGKIASETVSNTTTNATTLSFDMTDIDAEERYYIRLRDLQMQDAGELQVTFDGRDAAGNGYYEYFDSAGTQKTNQDNILIYETDTKFANLSGEIGYLPDSDRPNVSFRPQGQIGRVSSFSTAGAITVNVTDPTIQIKSTAGLRSGNTIELWGKL
jgi:hypothetical protein